MPKLTLNTIGSRYGSIDALNDNFDQIEVALENTLSRDGTVPNGMEADLDMGGFAIINVNEITVQGNSVNTLAQQAASSAQAAAISEVNAAASASNALASEQAAQASATQVEDAKLIWRGPWSSVTSYEVNDAVERNGTSYIATSNNINQEPPNASFWDILAERGTDGAPGPGSGDVSSDTATSVDNELVLFSGVSGKVVKRAVGTGIVKINSGVLATAVVGTDYLAPAAVGVSVQAYDAATAKTNVVQTFTAAQRGAVTTDNDLSFSMAAGNNFSCTTSGSGTLTFTNITAGQSGFILLVNASNHTISAAATTKITAADLTRISATGTYLVSYFSNGTDVFCVASGSLA